MHAPYSIDPRIVFEMRNIEKPAKIFHTEAILLHVTSLHSYTIASWKVNKSDSPKPTSNLDALVAAEHASL